MLTTYLCCYIHPSSLVLRILLLVRGILLFDFSCTFGSCERIFYIRCIQQQIKRLSSYQFVLCVHESLECVSFTKLLPIHEIISRISHRQQSECLFSLPRNAFHYIKMITNVGSTGSTCLTTSVQNDFANQ